MWALVDTYDEKTKLFFYLYYVGSESSQKAYVDYMLACDSEFKNSHIGSQYVALAHTVRRLFEHDSTVRNGVPVVPNGERELLIESYVEQSDEIKLSYEETTCELFEEYFNNEQELSCKFDELRLF
jgi:hypothetical protein